MEILYTWSWPRPRDTPVLQRELLLAAPQMDAVEGMERRSQDRQRDAVRSQSLSSSCRLCPQEQPLRPRKTFQHSWARRTAGFTPRFRQEVQQQQD